MVQQQSQHIKIRPLETATPLYLCSRKWRKTADK